jgi:hypothetical protein
LISEKWVKGAAKRKGNGGRLGVSVSFYFVVGRASIAFEQCVLSLVGLFKPNPTKTILDVVGKNGETRILRLPLGSETRKTTWMSSPKNSRSRWRISKG